MNLTQLHALAPQIAIIASSHGNLPSLVRIAGHAYSTQAELLMHLNTLELELRLLATGYEVTSGNGSTYRTRVDAAKACVELLDAPPPPSMVADLRHRAPPFAIVVPTAEDGPCVALRLRPDEVRSMSGPIVMYETMGAFENLTAATARIDELRSASPPAGSLADYERRAERARVIVDGAERKAALALLASNIRQIGWSPGVRGMALALADALTSEADEINADELSGLDALAARGVLRPL